MYRRESFSLPLKYDDRYIKKCVCVCVRSYDMFGHMLFLTT